MIFRTRPSRLTSIHAISGLAVFTATLLSGSAMAQVPSTAEPGVIQRQFDEKKQPSSKRDAVIKAPSAEAPASAAGSKEVFALKGVNVSGSSVYSDKDFDAITSSYIGKKVSFNDLNNIAKEITRKYRNDGYVLSTAVLVPQSVKGGAVTIKVVEGGISKVTIVGDLRDNRGLANAMAQKITLERPTKARTVERYLLLIDDLPGVTAKGVVKPGANPGESELVITVEHKKYEGGVSFDDRGSRYLGPFRGTGVVAGNSLLNWYDRTTVRGVMSGQFEEIKFADIAHEEQIGTEGGKVLVRGAVSKVHPGEDLDVFDIDGSSYLFDVSGKYPLIRSRAKNLELNGGFKILDTDTDIANIDITNDRVRTLRIGAAYDFTDDFKGVNLFDIEFAHGLDFFGSTDDGVGRSRTNGEHSFLKANAQVSRIQELMGDFSMLLAAAGQISADPLLASEEFSVGGASNNGRAYDGGEIVGDNGASAGIELRYGKPVDYKWLNSFQFYGFYDLGAVWNKSPLAGESDKATLASAGAGVRFNLPYALSGYTEIAFPLTRGVSAEKVNERDDMRIFFDLTKRF